MKRVLIVDCDKNFRKNLRIELENSDFEVIEASSGKEALQLQGVIPGIQLAILESRLTDTTGLGLFWRFQSEGMECPTILTTHYPQEHTREAAIKSGVKSYLEKPFDNGCSSIVSQIEKVFESSSLESQNSDTATITG